VKYFENLNKKNQKKSQKNQKKSRVWMRSAPPLNLCLQGELLTLTVQLVFT
jgi:hypothetical protein